MTHEQLRFSRSRLLGLFVGSLLMGIASGCLVLDGESLSGRRLGILSVLGPDGLRILLGGGATFFLAGSFGLLRRLLGEGTAAAIRYDGIVLNGVFMSAFIPWKSLDRLYMRGFRWGSNTYRYIKAEWRCPPDGSGVHHFFASLSYGTGTKLLKADDEEIVQWSERANAARIEALTPRVPAPPRAQQRTRVDFGRRAV